MLPETQFGLGPERGTCEARFFVRQFEKKCREQRRPILCFVDLKKAFNSVTREVMWALLIKPGFSEKFVRMLRLSYMTTGPVASR